jgi:hypothetical protein
MRVKSEGPADQLKKALTRKDQEGCSCELRSSKRRRKASNGYTYVSMVGWMDRREKRRRCDDKFVF